MVGIWEKSGLMNTLQHQKKSLFVLALPLTTTTSHEGAKIVKRKKVCKLKVTGHY